MASGGRDKRKKPDDDNTGNFFAFLGGAALGAVAAFGAKKLYEYFNEETPMEASHAGPNTSSSTGKFGCVADDEDDGYRERHSLSNSPVAQSNLDDDESKTGEEVIEMLHKYFHQYALIPERDLERAREVVCYVESLFNNYVKENASVFPVSDISINETQMDLLVVQPDNYIINVVITLDSQMWELVSASNTVLDSPGYFLVKRTNLEFFTSGTNKYDKYLVGDYLSPTKIAVKLRDFAHRLNWGSRYEVHPVISSESASIVVEYGDEKQVHIDFVPLIVLDSQSVIGEFHPKSKFSSGHENLWLESYLKEDSEKIKSILRSENCQKQCLYTFMALRVSSPAYFGMLHTEIFKAIFFQLAEVEDIWQEEMLFERFIDMLKTLEDMLLSKKCPHYFNPYVNLLDPYQPVALDNLRAFIAQVIGKNKFGWLLNCTR